MRFDADAYNKLYHSNEAEPDVKPDEPEETVPDDTPDDNPEPDEGGE